MFSPPPAIASTMVSASRFGRTSCTRWISAPRSRVHAVKATVGQALSPTASRPSRVPMKRFRDNPISKGRPVGARMPVARNKARLCSSDFPKPIPGS